MSPLDQGTSAKLKAAPSRFDGIQRDYTREDVARLSGSIRIEHTLAELGARRLWDLLHTRPYVACLGALTGNQAMQMVRAGLESIYLSGWQVAADANLAGQVYPDQSSSIISPISRRRPRISGIGPSSTRRRSTPPSRAISRRRITSRRS